MWCFAIFLVFFGDFVVARVLAFCFVIFLQHDFEAKFWVPLDTVLPYAKKAKDRKMPPITFFVSVCFSQKNKDFDPNFGRESLLLTSVLYWLFGWLTIDRDSFVFLDY